MEVTAPTSEYSQMAHLEQSFLKGYCQETLAWKIITPAFRNMRVTLAPNLTVTESEMADKEGAGGRAQGGKERTLGEGNSGE